MPQDLIASLRTDVLWHQRRGNDTIAHDCQAAADTIESQAAEIARLTAELEAMCANFDAMREEKNAVKAERDALREDAERLDWLLLNVCGAEFRRIGVVYIAGANRAAIDTARKAEPNAKLNGGP